VQSQHCVARQHTNIQEIKMLTLKLFDGWARLLTTKHSDNDLATWARIEYKKDSVYAYHHMLEHGVAPRFGAK